MKSIIQAKAENSDPFWSKPSLLLILFLLPSLSYPQFQDKIPQVKPLPPDAAALFKVLERPIGTYTGTVPVQFPLCGVSSGSLSANLLLNYNSTGGIRVEEAASSVGLGFSLSDGAGRITQIVNDMPDDQINGLLTHPIKPSNFQCNDMYDLWDAWDEYALDIEPDLFMYNFNGQSGRFFFKEDGSIVMMQKTGIKIEYNQNDIPSPGIQEWIITDEGGNKFYFNLRHIDIYQYTSLTNPSNKKDGVSSYSWYLTRAHDRNNENEITYTYETSGSLFTTFSGGFMNLYTLYAGAATCAGYNTIPDQAVVKTSAGEYVVSRINAEDGYIKVNSSADRLDGYARKVNSIELYTPDNQLVKKYKFQYGYFNDWSSDREVKRLKLKNFSEFGTTTMDSLTHYFEYDEFYNMPSRLSQNIDYWGYYNGKFNQSVFPNVVFKSGPVVIRRYNLADKNAVGAYAETNILTKITYPTGGYREFEYEGNTALVPFNPYEYHPDPSNSVTRYFTHSNNDFNFYNLDYDSITYFFSVNGTDGGTLLSYSSIIPYTCPLQVKLFKIDSINQWHPGIPIFDMNAEAYKHNIDNGLYRMEIYKGSTCTVSEVRGNWKELTLSLGYVQTPHSQHTSYNENNRPVGGVRVKEIRDFDPVTGETYTTQYKYKLYSTDSTLTSGLLILQPDLVAIENISGVECRYYKVLQSSHYPLASHGGSYVVYPEVRTIENGNGWIDQIYKYVADVPPFDFPYIPPIDNSAYRGQLLEEKVFDQDGTLLKKTTNTYAHYGWQNAQGGLKVKAYFNRGMMPGLGESHMWSEAPFVTNQLPSLGACNWFDLRGDAFDIRKTIDSTFTASGTHVTVTDYDYDFSYNDLLFLKRTKRTVNGGNTRVTTYNYAFSNNTNFAFGLTTSEINMKNDLLNKHYLLPLEAADSLLTTSGPDLLLGGQKFIFAYLSAGKTHLNRLRTYTSPSGYKDLNFTSYSDKGSLQERYEENDIKEAYLWGYNGQYPVAKVTGSDYSTISGFVNNTILQNPTSDLQLRTELDKIRTGLFNTPAQVTTYTYDPLVGMISQTDPNGQTVYYEYDDFNRLKLVKDQAGNIMQQYTYNYKDPQ